MSEKCNLNPLLCTSAPPESEPLPPLFLPSCTAIPSEGSLEWFKALIKVRFGYSEPRDWQVRLSKAKYDGQEVFAILPTGAGKSVLIYAPILAAKELKMKKIGIVIVPTKALAWNHVRGCFRLCGLR